MRPHVIDSLLAKLAELAQQHDALGRQLEDPAVAADPERLRDLSIRHKAMARLMERYHRHQLLQRQIDDNERLARDRTEAELAELAAAELPALRAEADRLLDLLADELVTADDAAVGAVILEVRAAAGGAEAALWAGDLLAMYQKYAAGRGWKMELMQGSEGEAGGLRQAVTRVSGPGVWQGLGYEGGVHCVKRVPATEAQGRVHTSTATVAVLPEPQALEIDIPDADVVIHVTTSQGPGGQNVNKVATAVNMVHTPTGIEVRMQESKSQAQNRQKAWQLLRARVYDHYQRLKDAERAENRSKMIGSGDRSERIRTYRWKDNLVVDHRLGESFNLQSVLAGELNPIVDALTALDKAQRLAAL